MRIRISWLITTALLGLLIGSLPAETQQTGKVHRVGFLGQGPPSFYTARFNAFRQELRARGYVEGRDVQYEYRYAGGKLDRLPDLASELLRVNVDVIVTTSTPSTRAAMTATRTVPIVMNAGTPVESGLVASLARPGGNVTGVTLLSGPEFYSKRVELLREIDNSVARVAVLLNANNSAHRVSIKALEAIAPQLGITVVAVSTDGTDNVDRTLVTLEQERTDALLAFGYPSSREHRRRIVEFVAQTRIPAIYPNPRWMASGGLISYSVDQADNARQKAIYVDRILKGGKPADLPVLRPVKFNLVVNMRTAKALGIAIPPSILYRANKVIE